MKEQVRLCFIPMGMPPPLEDKRSFLDTWYFLLAINSLVSISWASQATVPKMTSQTLRMATSSNTTCIETRLRKLTIQKMNICCIKETKISVFGKSVIRKAVNIATLGPHYYTSDFFMGCPKSCPLNREAHCHNFCLASSVFSENTSDIHTLGNTRA